MKDLLVVVVVSALVALAVYLAALKLSERFAVAQAEAALEDAA